MLGDWSVNISIQMKGCIPTPNKGITKLLMKRFEVVSIDEYKQANYITKNYQKNLQTSNLKTRNPNGVILNRDRNTCKKYFINNERVFTNTRKKAESSIKENLCYRFSS
jgi:hypothetical protein